MVNSFGGTKVNHHEAELLELWWTIKVFATHTWFSVLAFLMRFVDLGMKIRMILRAALEEYPVQSYDHLKVDSHANEVSEF